MKKNNNNKFIKTLNKQQKINELNQYELFDNISNNQINTEKIEMAKALFNTKIIRELNKKKNEMIKYK